MIFNNISLSSSVNVTYTNSVLNSGNIQFTVYFFKGKVQKYRWGQKVQEVEIKMFHQSNRMMFHNDIYRRHMYNIYIFILPIYL